MISSKGLTFTHQGSNPNPTGTGKSTVYAMSDGLYVDGNKLAASGAGADYSEMTISTTPFTTNISQNDWDTGGYYNLNVNGAGITINGILQDPSCRVKTLTNSNTSITNIQTITHMSGVPADPTSRIYVNPMASDYKLLPGETVILNYSQADTWWTLMSSRLSQNEWMPLNMSGVLLPLGSVISVSSSNAFYKQTYAGPGGVVEIVFNMIPSLPTPQRFFIQFNIPSFCGTVESGGGSANTIVGTCTQIIPAGSSSGRQGSVFTFDRDDHLEILGGAEAGTNPQCQVRILFVRKT